MNTPVFAARWRALGVVSRDAVSTVLLAPLVFAPVTAPIGAQFGDLPERSLGLPGVLVTAALWLPLVLRRSRPVGCLALIAGAFAVHELVGYPQTCASLGLYLALYSLGAHGDRAGGLRRALAVAVAVAVVAFTLFAAGLHHRGSPQQVPDYVLMFLILVVCWAVGTAVRARQDGEAERRRLSVEAATARERARIARELHDVVTHHVTAMVVQADAAQFLLDDAPARVGTGLEAISDTGRRALRDLQHLLGVLKASASTEGASSAPDRTPEPGGLSELVERTRTAGQPVELAERGERRELAAAVDLAAYRVVQEALTNALKHAPGHRTLVRVHYGRTDVEVEVTTEGAPATAPATEAGAASGQRRGPLGRGGGHGLIGLRERVSVFGGELSTGDRPDGGFSVRARIPSAGHGEAAARGGEG
ncbi:sensor histidine kinase [Streptomyces sp. NPDC102365]|uniref:sensor histidine kinase n=1 Tax=Streptomyces sp. NPDC102365 TaxID=3366162 RepID=UPI003814E389